MEMNRRQFLKGLVQVAVVVTSVYLVPDCLPLANPHEPQPVKVQKWRIYGAMHQALFNDGDEIWMNEQSGERIRVVRIDATTLQVERNMGRFSWSDQAMLGQKLGNGGGWFHESVWGERG